MCSRPAPHQAAGAIEAPLLLPAVLILSASATWATVVLPALAPARPVAAFWFLAVCPGMALVGLTDLRKAAHIWTVGVALSGTLDVLVAGTLIYARAWSPSLGLAILVGITLVGAALQLSRSNPAADRAAHLAVAVPSFSVTLVPFAALLVPMEGVAGDLLRAGGIAAGALLSGVLVALELRRASVVTRGDAELVSERPRAASGRHAQVAGGLRISAGQRTVALVDRALTAAVAGLAALGCFRRLRLGHLDLAGIVLVLAALPLIMANSYGGEMVFRIYFFGVPFAVFFAAGLLYPTRAFGVSWRTIGIAIVISGVLLADLMLAYYGKGL